MKVFMMIKKLRYSGAYKMFMWVAKALADRGHEVTVCTYMENLVTELPSNIKWVQKNLEGQSILNQYCYVRQMIKESDADVSISFLLDANLLNLLACCKLRTKSIVCERNDPYKPHYYKLKLTKSLFRLADGAVFQLPKVAEYYSMIKGMTAVIPNPVISTTTTVEIMPFDERKNVIVSLGRLDIFQKRQDVLLRAFAKFLKKHQNYKLELYGDGPDENKLKEMVLQLGIQNNVVFGGVTHESIKILSKSKFYVLSSDFEGIPNSLLEAMSLGLPCISTRCRPGGAEYLIEDGANGLLVDTGNVEDMYHAMVRIADSGIADDLGHEAKKLSEYLSEERITDMWCEYIQSFNN